VTGKLARQTRPSADPPEKAATLKHSLAERADNKKSGARTPRRLEMIMLGHTDNRTNSLENRVVVSAPEAAQAAVLVVGGDMLFREGLKRLLQTAPFALAGEAERLAELESAKAAGVEPAIVIVIDAPVDPKAEWVGEIRRLWGETRIVALSNGGDEGHLSAALVQAINLVALGENVAPLRMARALAEGGKGRQATAGEARLTPREKDILQGLLAGQSNKVIANSLGTTDMTVKAQLRHLLRKIGATNRTQAALWARENGIDRDMEDAPASPKTH